MNDPIQEQHEQEFHLRGTPEVYEERTTISRKGEDEVTITKSAILILDQFPSEFTKFRFMYVEDDFIPAKPLELVVLLGHPIHKPCRVALAYPNNRCNQLHFKVMSYNCEQIIVNQIDHLKELIPCMVVKQSDEQKYNV